MTYMLRNKLIKDNRLTFSILAISVVISFAVFVYVIMQVFEWTDYKEETEKGTITNMIKLEEQKRVHEIAQMMSGEQMTDSAMEAARNLIMQK